MIRPWLNAGAQSVDITPLFGAALSSVEILRDNAVAQYGSDAIAGVMNYNLLSDPDVRRITMRYGEAYKGDGATVEGSGAFGMHIGDGGFATLAFEMRDQPAKRTSPSLLVKTSVRFVGSR